MSPDELLSLADNPDFIPGIYNYCDRWCERCHITSRCLLYASTPREETVTEGSPEDYQHSMIRQIEDTFQLTIDLLNKLAREHDIDLNATEEDDNAWEQHKLRRQQADKSPLTILAKKYIDHGRKWLDNSDDLFRSADEELAKAAVMELPNRDLQKEADSLKNAMDVIFWYKFQIMVKLVRAQTTEADVPELLDDDGNPFPKDSVGSAKVALIGIDNSIVAWSTLLDYFPDEEKPVLEILSVLVKLRKMTERYFPEARSFIRPGLDGVTIS